MAHPTRSKAAETMIGHGRCFYDHGWMLGTSGNLSVRLDEESFLVTASGRDKGQLTPEDFVTCGIDHAARPEPPTFDPSSPAASAESAIHRVIYDRLPNTGAIYHVHEPYAAYCSERDNAIGATIMAGAEMIKGLGIWEEHPRVRIPILDNHFEVSAIAADVADHIDSQQAPTIPGVNLRSHGVYAWGQTPFAAKRHVETFAYLFRYSWELGNGA